MFNYKEGKKYRLVYLHRLLDLNLRAGDVMTDFLLNG